MDPAVFLYLLVMAVGLGLGVLDARFKFEKRLRGSGRRLLRRPNYTRIAELERELGIGQGVAVLVPTPVPALDGEEAPTQRMQADTARATAQVEKGPALPLEEALRGVNEPLRGDLRRLAAWEQNAGRALLAYRYEENGVTVVEIDRVRPTS